jgi:VIT1/CCC1 family predicted Fe2+/Mn2+ transporter
MFEPPELDEDGFPVPHTKEAIAAATIDGNYTQSPEQAVSGTADEVDIEYRAILGVKSRVKAVEGESEEEQAKNLAKAVNAETQELAKRAARHGIDATVALAPVARLIAEAHDQISKAQKAA